MNLKTVRRRQNTNISVQTTLFLTAAIFILCACSNTSGSNTQTNDSSAGTENKKTILEPGDIAAINKLVTTWLDAQNSGNFELYAGLYDPGFSGVKRVGEKTTSYDYAAWLADRKRMFGAPMIVKAFDTGFTPYNGKIMVQFTQNWSSGTYRDTGRKVMTVAKGSKGYTIYREEMLDSRILPPNTALDQRVSSVLPVHHGTYLILDVNQTTVPGGSRNVFVDRNGTAEIQPPETAIPESYKSLIGRQFRVADSAGKQELVSVESIVIVAACVPHFGQVHRWTDGDGDQGVPSEQTVADETVAMAAPFWAARITLNESFQADFAWPEDSGEPAWFEKTTLSQSAADDLKTAFRSTDSWASLAEGYAEAKAPDDPEWPGDATQTYLAYQNGENRVLVSKASFYLNMSSMAQTVFWSEESGTLKTLCNLSLPVDSTALPDFNHNGVPDMVIDSGYGERTMFVDGEALWSFTIPFYDCPF